MIYVCASIVVVVVVVVVVVIIIDRQCAVAVDRASLCPNWHCRVFARLIVTQLPYSKLWAIDCCGGSCSSDGA